MLLLSAKNGRLHTFFKLTTFSVEIINRLPLHNQPYVKNHAKRSMLKHSFEQLRSVYSFYSIFVQKNIWLCLNLSTA